MSGASPSSQKVPGSWWGYFRQLTRSLLYFAYEFLCEILQDIPERVQMGNSYTLRNRDT
jgi:hypothetical protein